MDQITIPDQTDKNGYLMKFFSMRAKYFFDHFVRPDQKAQMQAQVEKDIGFAHDTGYTKGEIWLEFKMFSANQIIVSVCTAHGGSSSTPYYCDIEPGFFKSRQHNLHCCELQKLPYTI